MATRARALGPRFSGSAPAAPAGRLAAGALGALLGLALVAPGVFGATPPSLSAKLDRPTVPAVVPSVVDVLANDLPGQATATRPLEITAVTQGAHGSVTTDGRSVVYNPAACWTGSDLFTYTITDGVGQSTVTDLVTVAAPASTASPLTDLPQAGFVTGGIIGSTVPLRLTWCGVPTAGAKVKVYRVEQGTNGGASYPTVITSATTATSSTRSVTPGVSYAWRVRTTDTRNRTGAWAPSLTSRVTRFEDSSPSIAWSSGWTTSSSSKYSGGRERSTTKAGATATTTVSNVRAVAVVASTATSRGSFALYVDGVKVATVSERSSTAAWRKILAVRGLTSGTGVTHTVQVRALGNGRINLDAILTLSGKRDQAITFGTAAGAVYSDLATASATASSGLPVTFAVARASWPVCTIGGTGLAFLDVGTCSLVATQPGDQTWNARTDTLAITVGPRPLAVTGVTADGKTYDGTTDATVHADLAVLAGIVGTDDVTLTGTATATGAFADADAGAGRTVTVAGLGLAGADAAKYDLVPPTVQADIAKADQAITFTAPDTAVKGGQDHPVSASADSGLGVTIAVNPASAGVCTYAAGIVSFPGSGTCELDADQAGDANWNAAPTKPHVITVADTGTTPQAVTFDQPDDATYGDGPVALDASADSGLPVTLTSLTPGVCTVGDGSATLVAAGACQVEATQAGDPTYAAAADVTRSFAVAPKPLTVTGITAGDKTYDGTTAATLDPSAATLAGVVGTDDVSLDASGAAATFADADAGPAVTVHVSGLSLSGARAADYVLVQPATTASIGKASVGVTPDPQAKAYGDADPAFTFTYGAFVVGETSAVVDTPPACGVVGPHEAVAGSPYPITCSGGADGNYAFDDLPGGSLTVSPKALAVDFTAADRPYDGTTSATITGCSLTGVVGVDDVACDPGAATAGFATPGAGVDKAVTGSGFALSGTDAGNYAIGTVHAAAATISKAAQAIAFSSAAPAPATAAGATYTVAATGGASGNPVTFTIDGASASVCSIAADVVSFLAQGTCTIHADQAGDADHDAAPQATQAVTVAPHAQAITFGALGAMTYGDAPFGVAATADSGLPVTFASLTPGVCGVSGSSVTLLAAGGCTVRATQAGDATYAPATPVDRPFTVAKATLTVTADDQAIAYGDADPAFTFHYGAFVGTDTAGDIDTPPACGVAGPHTAVAGSPYPITCSGGIDDSYDFDYVAGQLTVSPASQAIAFAALPDRTYGDAPFALAATAGSGLPVTFASLTASVCTVAGSDVTLVAAGSCTIRASQPGDGDWAPAPDVSRSFTVARRAITVTATTDSRPADGTTASSATPTITAGSLAAGDTATLAQAFDTPAAGVGKVLTPTAAVAHGPTDVTSSYTITVVPDATGVITPAALHHVVIAPATATIAAGDRQAFTLQAFDAFGNSRGDVTADATFGIDDPAGSCVLAECGTDNPGQHAVTGDYLGHTDAATLTVVVGPADLGTSTITASPTTIAADGVATSTVTVRLRDRVGNVLVTSGGTVTLEAEHGSLGAVTDNGDGTYSATYTADTFVGGVTIEGKLDGADLVATATVTQT